MVLSSSSFSATISSYRALVTTSPSVGLTMTPSATAVSDTAVAFYWILPSSTETTRIIPGSPP